MARIIEGSNFFDDLLGLTDGADEGRGAGCRGSGDRSGGWGQVGGGAEVGVEEGV